jgi:hypothetical protein
MIDCRGLDFNEVMLESVSCCILKLAKLTQVCDWANSSLIYNTTNGGYPADLTGEALMHNAIFFMSLIKIVVFE